jgi:hypothetical protein
MVCHVPAMIVNETRWSLMFLGEGEKDPTDAGTHLVVSVRIRPTQILGKLRRNIASKVSQLCPLTSLATLVARFVTRE